MLGAEIPAHGEEWGQYLLSGWHLNAHSPGGIDGLRDRRPVEPGNSDLCFVWPGLIEESIAHLQAYGVPIEVGPIRTAVDDGTHVYFRDPDGSRLEFVCYPGQPD